MPSTPRAALEQHNDRMAFIILTTMPLLSQIQMLSIFVSEEAGKKQCQKE